MTGLAPRPDPRDAPFWDGCRQGVIHVVACSDCDEHFFPPQERCPTCRSPRVDWRPAGDSGTLYTFTVIHSPGPEGRPGPGDQYPYAVGVVELDGGGGARIAGRLQDVPLDQIRIGLRVKGVFETTEPALPTFRPISAG